MLAAVLEGVFECVLEGILKDSYRKRIPWPSQPYTTHRRLWLSSESPIEGRCPRVERLFLTDQQQQTYLSLTPSSVQIRQIDRYLDRQTDR